MGDTTFNYLVATGVGGTCTDTVVFTTGEPIHLGKALSTRPNFPDDVLHSVGSSAGSTCLSLEELLSRTSLFVHGSTVVDNAIFTRDGAKVGRIATEGFEDTSLITTGGYESQGGLAEDRMKNLAHTDVAKPFVSPRCVFGVPEPTDYQGQLARAFDDVVEARLLPDNGFKNA